MRLASSTLQVVIRHVARAAIILEAVVVLEVISTALVWTHDARALSNPERRPHKNILGVCSL
jgi:hypothetical protein